ncbi:hypothetical protein AKJ16_DCAP08328 [Drosera capensis]
MADLSTLSSTQSPFSPHNPDSLTGTGDCGNGEVSGCEIRVLGVEIGDMSGGGVGEESVVGNGGRGVFEALWGERIWTEAFVPRVCAESGLVHVLVKQLAAASSNIEEIFSCLPLPYIEEEFAIDSTWKSDHKNGKIEVRTCFTISLLLFEFKEIFSCLPLPCMEEKFTIDSTLKSDEKNRKIEEIFGNLPLPYVLEEFKIDSSLKASGNPE